MVLEAGVVVAETKEEERRYFRLEPLGALTEGNIQVVVAAS